MRPVLAYAALASLLLGGCDRAPAEPRVTVEQASVNLPALPGRPGAAYFILRTNNDPTRLVSVTSPMVERIELHESRVEGGVTTMGPARDLTFRSDGELRFETGGRHAMLFGVDPALRPGARIPLTFTFDPAPAVTVDAEVRPPGDHGGH